METKSLQAYLQEIGAHFWVHATSRATVVVVDCGCDYYPIASLEELHHSKELCCDDPNCWHVAVWTCDHIDKADMPVVKTMGDVWKQVEWDGGDPF